MDDILCLLRLSLSHATDRSLPLRACHSSIKLSHSLRVKNSFAKYQYSRFPRKHLSTDHRNKKKKNTVIVFQYAQVQPFNFNSLA